jgi:hypothetical protein
VKDRIQSWASIILGAAVVVLVAWLTTDQMSRTHIRAERLDSGTESTSDSGSASAANAAATDAGASSTGTGSAAGSGGLGTIEAAGDGGFSLTGLTSLLDAGAMPTGAPRAVRLGVVLVQWAGAEGAPGSARAKPDALKRALELAEQAKTDWKAAVKAGDSGSSEDIGRIPRGVLERTTEVAVFSLDKDGVSEPLETPRGYWVVRRVE